MVKIRREFFVIITCVALLFTFSYFEWQPVKSMMEWKTRTNARATQVISVDEYTVMDYSNGNAPFITVDFLKGKHFWHPQMAIWVEDSAGNYLETLLVTISTAKGLFYSGRSAENFKQFDEAKSGERSNTRRVDALPYWSHKRGVKYPDGFYSPPPDQPLPDGISGATPVGNLYFMSGDSPVNELNAFKIRVEVNVAFDENEYYSEYDFVNDTLYHGGTGLLGQPSMVYGATIRNTDSTRYYVLEVLGHGHHSGGNGELYAELNTITTARYIVERLVVGVDEQWYLNMY
jgi:hypothetical protein